MKNRRVFTVLSTMICLMFMGAFFYSDTVYTKKITSMEQAVEKALAKVEGAVVIETDKDYENGKLVYEVHLVKNTKEYEIIYRASDGKMISYGWEKNNVSSNHEKKLISKKKCKKLARKVVKKGKITKIVRKYDDGISIYKVKMKKSNKKYELKFHGRTGQLIEYQWEWITPKSKNEEVYIGIDKAKSIALKEVEDAIVVKVEFEKEDGIALYEVELIKDEYEYDIKINAKTGEILEIDKEYMD